MGFLARRGGDGVSDEEDFPINYKGSPADYSVWCQICNQGFNDACHPDLDCSCDICPDCYLEANKECPDCNNHRELYGCTDKEVTA